MAAGLWGHRTRIRSGLYDQYNFSKNSEKLLATKNKWFFDIFCGKAFFNLQD